MIKYPVTSKNDNVYYVTANESRYYEGHYEIGIYTKYKGWFNRDKYLLLNEGFMGGVKLYDLRECNFDVIGFVKALIANMEDDWKLKDDQRKLREIQNKKFEDWNGDC